MQRVKTWLWPMVALVGCTLMHACSANAQEPTMPAAGTLTIAVEPEMQEVGRPVTVRVTGIPAGEHFSGFSWSPIHPEDVRLELFDGDGHPVTVFWSPIPGTRTIEVVTAINGPKVPTIQFIKKPFAYGPDPIGPTPGPRVTPPPAPTDVVLTAIVKPLQAMLKDDPQSGTSIAGLYMAVADATRRDKNISKTSDLRAFLSLAEEDAYLNTAFVGKFPGFAKIVNEGYGRYVGLKDEPLDVARRAKSAAFFSAVAWACFPQSK